MAKIAIEKNLRLKSSKNMIVCVTVPKNIQLDQTN